MLRNFVFVILVLAAFSIPVAAQTASSGTIIGSVTDPSGAIIPGVTIELKDVGTGVGRTTVANESGRYAFVGVLPGKYSIKASLAGFQDVIVPQAVVEVGKSYTIDLQLQIGQAQSVVEVTSAAGAELQTLDASVGTVVGGDALMLMPTLTRNVTNLVLFQPTSIPQQASSQSSIYGGQVAGAHSDQNTIVLDGGNVTNGISANSDYFVNFNGGPEGAIPTPVESIQEFRVSTSNPSASFSGSSGSETILVTKRGNNGFHGSAYWFLQNDELNANTWDRNRLAQTRPKAKTTALAAASAVTFPG